MSRISEDMKKIDKIVEDLQNYLIDEISKIEDNKEMTPIGNNCFTVKMSTITQGKSIILSPFYYDFKLQKELVINHIRKSKNAGVNYINDVIETGKDKASGHIFNPIFVEKLKSVISK